MAKSQAKRNLKIKQLAERDGSVCWICGYEIENLTPSVYDLHNNSLAANVDHFIPVAKNGNNKFENLRLSHRCCNVRRAHQDVTPEIRAWCRRTVERLRSEATL